jgi:chemotaxis protein methyltransferase CheR
MDNTILYQIKALICAQTGLRILNDEAALQRLFYQRLKSLKLATEADYCQRLQGLNATGWEDESEYLSSVLTTGETFFFRDQSQYELLQLQILPELIKRNRATRRLKIWSAGCASGEEPYSLAMLLDEMDEDLAGWDILILGSDISPEALAKAKIGHYNEWSFRMVSEQRRQRFFQPLPSGWMLKAEIRQRVQFRQMNLVTESYPRDHNDLCQMDLILCRNVFIYLEAAMVTQIATNMTATLAEGGFLVTGHGELYAHQLGELSTRIFPHSIVYQKTSHPQLPIPVQTFQPITKPAELMPPHTKTLVEKIVLIRPKFKALVTKSIDATVTIKVAWTHANQGQPEQALACCNQLITQTPLDHHPYYLSALLAQEQGDLEQAKSLLKKVMYLAPNFIAAYIELAEIYVKEKNMSLAKIMWSAAAKLLKQLPKDISVEMFGNSTVADMIKFVENKSNN